MVKELKTSLIVCLICGVIPHSEVIGDIYIIGTDDGLFGGGLDKVMSSGIGGGISMEETCI